MAQTQELLNTARPHDAAACGYGSPIDYDMGGLKITFEADQFLGPCVTINGMDGELKLTGEAEVNEVIRALQTAVRRNAALAVRAMGVAA